MSEQKMGDKKSSVFIIVVIILVAALAAEGYILLRQRANQRPAEATEAIALGEHQHVETFGDDDAPIKVEFYAPLVLEWHQKTIGLLREYDEQHPGRIHVTLMPMGQPECDAEIHGRGHTCAVIFINGTNEFTLSDGRQLTLEKRPNQSTSSYNSEDVIAVLEQLP